MAAVFVPPSPRISLNMSTRRPLANVPNATNSPHRAGLVPAKRPRTTNAPIDIPYGQPPLKKQVIDGLEQEARTPPRVKSSTITDSKLFTRRSNNAQPSAFERKLVAARDKERQTQLKGTRQEKPSAESIESIRQWQRHYRKAFPSFVFYFDAIPEDVRAKCSRQVIALGASEEKFFSRDVTHVVTSRPIPPELNAAADLSAPNVEQGPVDTVNPSLLEKTVDTHLHMSLKTDTRREQSNMDVLYRARRMKMKIWALEKLQRMIAAINDGDIGGHGATSTRTQNAAGGNTRARGETDLSQVLRSELINGPSDRDPLSSLKELVMFKGPFVYVHDMDEKTKPVMVREYPKVARRQDGTWPQFRSAPLGKCPFIDEPPTKKEIERHRALQQEKDKKAAAKAVPVQQTHDPKPNRQDQAPVTKDNQDIPNEIDSEDNVDNKVSQIKPTDMQKPLSTKPAAPRKSSESFVPPQLHRGGPFYAGREPAASGVQPSNITSAIRSQMVSSTAAGPGAKAGISKEVHELKRKVLEKSNGGLSTSAMLSPHLTTSLSTSFKMNQLSHRTGQTNTQDKRGHVQEEDTTQSEGNGAKRRTGLRKVMTQKKKERRRDPKPGYCENCRDKFDDFEEHIMTRKHRKFATNPANWVDLDELLDELERPLKEQWVCEAADTP
ncbi:protein serine/threonine kinase activating protein nimO [Aspergillus clavatus NRRL 1]|uniref:DBF zinc finger domain protein n=1 Tax=Aspergillus clavatus (strain ATCC 1007 / CBS 513.65 / DSM 816 / NCTC 3887 / NRRL 1 / QM 1276 / 107) TaxID=344612 RepID=A1CTI9_ASPCL|nr:DBF zinc finger domain protein [Aspergillus clavatus NRRL 1]EAW06626.1 DBF zinc finger domain protein [Aspergillus clavatus NRRL 1]